MVQPRRLPPFLHEGKVWTMDERLREFRHVVFGQRLEFVPFDSRLGQDLAGSLVRVVRRKADFAFCKPNAKKYSGDTRNESLLKQITSMFVVWVDVFNHLPESFRMPPPELVSDFVCNDVLEGALWQ